MLYSNFMKLLLSEKRTFFFKIVGKNLENPGVSGPNNFSIICSYYLLVLDQFYCHYYNPWFIKSFYMSKPTFSFSLFLKFCSNKSTLLASPSFCILSCKKNYLINVKIMTLLIIPKPHLHFAAIFML